MMLSEIFMHHVPLIICLLADVVTVVGFTPHWIYNVVENKSQNVLQALAIEFFT